MPLESEVVNYIPTNEHVFVSGKTGTGKSYLTEEYVTGYKYVVKLDTKDETMERKRKGLSAWRGLIEGQDFTVCRNFEQLDDIETPKIIYVMDYDEQNEDGFNRFFRWIFERENTVLWIDELTSVGSSYSVPKEYGRLMQQGRSKNIAVWNCTQRPSGIPQSAIANSTHFFIFQTALPADRKKLVELTGQQQLGIVPKGKHQFYYYRLGDDYATLSILVQ